MKPARGICAGTLLMALAIGSLPLRAGIVSPDSRHAAYTIPAYDADGNLYNEVFVQDTDGSSKKALGKAVGRRDQVSWVGNDRIAAREFALGNSFTVFNINGRQAADIVLPSECKVLYMTLSPDGEKVAFTGSKEVGDKQRSGLFVYDVKSGAAKLLIEKNIKTLAAWSPDSRELAIGAGASYTMNHPLEIVDITSGKVEETGVLGVGASWSPDGKRIACTTKVERGGSWFAGVPTGGQLGIYDVAERKMRIVEGSEGALEPAWSKSGKLVAYIAQEKIGIASSDGAIKAVVQPANGEAMKPPVQMGWAGDEAVYLRGKNYFARLDVAQAKTTTLAEWEEPQAPELKPGNFKVIELPRVTVRYAGFDKQYAEAFGRILGEALKVYESLGFKMPAKVSLTAEIDPNSTALWTDGESQMFLHLKSKALLAPATRTGVFNLYGMCHELGHIAMYRNMGNLMGLPQGVPEGWAHYAGSVVVTEVAARLGKSIWPESYDVADVEGIGRLKRAAAQAKPWDQMDPTSRAALVFYKIETEYGRAKLAAAMTAALAEHPSGKALMPLFLAKLRAVTSDPAAADWVPESVLAPQVDWQTRERHPGEDFFEGQKVDRDKTGLWLSYDDGTMEGKQSMSGAAETVLFRAPEGAWLLDGIRVFGARYGTDEPPKEDISIYLCDSEFNLLHEIKAPYSAFEKGAEKWVNISFAPVEVPRTFYLGIDFHATATKGVYVGMDKGVRRSHSRIAMPYTRVGDLKVTADWMLRAHLRAKR